MSFYDQLDKIVEILRQRGRVSYRALQREFDLDAALLEDLKVELVDVQRLARDERGTVLVWVGANEAPPTRADDRSPSPPSSRAEAERRQVTVMFCNLARSAELAGRLDPEELRDLLRAYQDAADGVVRRFGGVIARYVGDGLLIYFGYPRAHEDDAERAARAGLGIVGAMRELQARLQPTLAPVRDIPLQVCIGLHTGFAVMGTMGDSTHRDEMAAVGETPNLAARVQGCADPDTVLLTETTYRLLRGHVACTPLGLRSLKGIAASVPLYRLISEPDLGEPEGTSARAWSTPLVGREQEVELLLERSAQVTEEGLGQIVLITGEAGIGKSRLIGALKTHLRNEPHLLLETRCSPYHQHSALYPLTELLWTTLEIDRQQPVEEQLAHLEQTLSRNGLAATDVVPFVAPLLGLPLPETRYAPPGLSPERHRQRTLETALALVLGLSTQQPVLLIVEDLHWVDPSTLQWLTLLVEQAPTARLFALLTARPDFSSPWGSRAHMTALTLSRLRRAEIEHLIRGVVGSKTLPLPVIEQVATKTDGIPLFVEELTKMVLESGLLREQEDRYELVGALPPLAIPATLQDSLMARLDRLATVKVVAQLGAAIGRSFSFGLLQAVAALDEEDLRRELRKLVEAELLYQRGAPPQTTYTFKHALIQDAAYQTLLKSTRQQFHQRIAHALEAKFPETAETQPELLAHHYAEAGLAEQAVRYWQQAGRRALERSAYVEGIAHLARGLAKLQTLPETPARIEQELHFQTALGPALMATKGQAAPEVEHAYTRARELCGRMGETADLFPVLWGLWYFYLVRADCRGARTLGEQVLKLAQRVQDPTLVMLAHRMLGQIVYFQGEFTLARQHLDGAIALYDPEKHRSLAVQYVQDPGVVCRVWAAFVMWALGYPDQAAQRSAEAIRLARTLAHPYSLALALNWSAWVHFLCRDEGMVNECAEAARRLCAEHDFPLTRASHTMLQGAAGTDREESVDRIRQGLTAWRATGAEIWGPYWLALLAEACGRAGRVAEGLALFSEAEATADRTGEQCWESEVYRIKGELLLRQADDPGGCALAETTLSRALDIARRQQAKSLELRAATSLGRLWHGQGKKDEARGLLSETYGWFTEGFDTADLREAKALLDGWS